MQEKTPGWGKGWPGQTHREMPLSLPPPPFCVRTRRFPFNARAKKREGADPPKNGGIQTPLKGGGKLAFLNSCVSSKGRLSEG